MARAGGVNAEPDPSYRAPDRPRSGGLAGWVVSGGLRGTINAS
jgi:hypothetical protein